MINLDYYISWDGHAHPEAIKSLIIENTLLRQLMEAARGPYDSCNPIPVVATICGSVCTEQQEKICTLIAELEALKR